jgi:hypothetical protein
VATSSSAGRRLPWLVAGCVLVGALVVTGRLLGPDQATRPTAATAGSAGRAVTTSRPAPAGAVQVEGVFLVPTGEAFRASCRRAANRLGFAVPCPQLLPVPSAGLAPPGLCGENGHCGTRLLSFAMDGFLVPPGFTGAPGSLGALSIWATADPEVAAGMERWCPDQRQVTPPALNGRPAVLANCPAGFLGWSTGSVLLRWWRGGTLITLGLRGQSEGNRRLLVRLAASLRPAPPP